MNKRGVLLPIMTLPIAAAVAAPAAKGVQEEAKKPNIVFIFADDFAYNCTGYGGLDNIQTPNIDRLKANGIHFTHAFNQGGWSGAISAASRTMLVTGENMWKAATHAKFGGSWPKGNPLVQGELQPFNTSWPEYMKQEGYDTYITGKWHVKLSPKKIFDNVKNIRGGMAKQSADCYNRVFLEGVTDAWQPYDTEYGGYWEGGKHWSEVGRDDALEYIEQAKDGDNPYFMYLAFNAPHDPRQSPREYIERYPLDEISMPENFMPEYPYKDQIGCSKSLRDEKLAPFPRTELSVKTNRQEYYALITHLDEQIGEILDALEESGEMDNTYIFFTADHGIAIGDHGLLGKQNMYDASMRVPLLMAGPNIEKGREIDDLVYLQDVMATALDLAGSEGVDVVDFESLLPLALNERGAKGRDAVYGAYMGIQRSVRDERYKMIIYPNLNMVRLYDLKRDPHEMRDIAGDKRNKKVMLRLFEQFKQLQQEVGGDPLDATPYFEEFISKL